MPMRKPTRRPRRKYNRKPRRARVNKIGGLIVARQNTLVPDRLFLKMSYKDNISLNYPGSPFTYHDFRLNSIYDPDLAVTTGHQPLGYDQWSVFYNKYRVYKASVKVTIVSEQDTTLRCGLVPYNSQAFPSQDDSFFEQPHAVTKVCAGQNGMNRVILQKEVHCPRIMGKSSQQYRSSELTSSGFGNNPQEQIWARVGISNLDDDVGTTAYALLEIIYHVELFDRSAQGVSAPQYKKENPLWKL